jgi:tetratricopeptide (TPR) repeat protein
MSGGTKEKQLWIGDYMEAKGNLFNVYNQIARQIAGEVKISLTPKEETKLAESRTINPEAIDAITYIEGLNTQLNYSQDTLIKAMDLLNNAIKKEPDWAPLYAWRGILWCWLSYFGYESPDNTLPKVHENINKALALDPENVDANGLNAEVAMTYEWNWEKAETGFKKLLELDPNCTAWRTHYGDLLSRLQRPEEAKKQMDLAYKLDPLSTFSQAGNAVSLCCLRDYKSAMSILENLLATDPDNVMLNSVMENAAYACGDLSRGFEATKRYITVFPFEKGAMTEIERTYNERGFKAATEEIIRQLEILAEKGHPQYLDMAFRYYVINQDDKAIEYLEKAFKVHEGGIDGIGEGINDYSRLYDNSRFIALVKKMNLPLPKSD